MHSLSVVSRLLRCARNDKREKLVGAPKYDVNRAGFITGPVSCAQQLTK
jgi:hypothetical protein